MSPDDYPQYTLRVSLVLLVNGQRRAVRTAIAACAHLQRELFYFALLLAAVAVGRQLGFAVSGQWRNKAWIRVSLAWIRADPAQPGTSLGSIARIGRLAAESILLDCSAPKCSKAQDGA